MRSNLKDYVKAANICVLATVATILAIQTPKYQAQKFGYLLDMNSISYIVVNSFISCIS
jgi:hypothetical protein